MSSVKVKRATVKGLEIEGDLTFSTIDKNTARIMDKLLTPNDITVNLKQVNATDSAGLALIIEWLKIARSRNITLTFINAPQQLQALALLSGFESLFQSVDQANEIAQ
jgi:phospholipid transport system transporter-binding protein